jgi:hypothetical protein
MHIRTDVARRPPVNGLPSIGKILIFTGIVLVIAGCFFLWSGKIPFPGKLPGDIVIKRDNTHFYFPLTTCILISIVLSLIVYCVNKFKG